MKKILFLLLFSSLNSWSQTLSEEAEFGLVTVSPGSTHDAVYQIWGHTVFHLKDPKNGINECYDYGTFNFNQPNFIGKFLKGTLPYHMAIIDYDLFVNHYLQKENRSTTERIINLNSTQKQALYDFLVKNYQPENREYRYRFFYYNCASRLRDILLQVCGKDLKFDDNLNDSQSYREWIHTYAKNKLPWTDFGMSLAIGMPADEPTKAAGAMFLPDNLATGFEQATILQNGIVSPLIKQKIQVTQAPEPELSTSIFTPFNVFLGLFLLILGFTVYQIKNQSKNILLDKIFFSILGIMGWFILGLWFFTDHGVTENNLNVIWAMPFLMPIIFFQKTKPWVRPFLNVYTILLFLFLVLWYFIPQGIPKPVIFIILIALTRIYFLLKSPIVSK